MILESDQIQLSSNELLALQSLDRYIQKYDNNHNKTTKYVI